MSQKRGFIYFENTFDRFGHINMKILVKTFGWMSQKLGFIYFENTFDRFGHCCTNMSVKTLYWMSQKRQNSFPENTFARFGHCCTNISGFWAQNVRLDVPKTGFHLFWKHVYPVWAHQHKDFRHFVQIMWFFLLGVFGTFLFKIFLRAYMMCAKKLQKSSAIYLVRVEFSQKSFVDLIFGHRFLSIFSKIFRVLCKVE